MGDYQKVRVGQPLKISAKCWNRVLDTVSTQPAYLTESRDYSRTNLVVQILNTTSATIPVWGVLEVSGVVNDPTKGSSAAAQWHDTPVIKGTTPTGSTAAKFVIVVEPIKAGKIGRAAIDGVVQCKLDIKAASDLFASPQASATSLKTGQSGEAAILWKENGTGSDKWGLVRIGNVRSLVRGTFTGSWAKGATATVTDAVASSVTYTAKNYFTPITGTGTKDCSIAYVGGEWILVDFNLQQLAGFDAAKTQVLGSEYGALKWLDTTACT